MSGISGLTKMSGNEHKDITKQLLGCLVNAGPKVPADAIRATRALLDFLYIAQYESHTTESLKFLQEALDEFHKTKNVFLALGARLGDGFKLPKLHALQHYIDSIRLFGTTDNCNTESTERLHIDLAKVLYEQTNHKEYLEQMVALLERNEKMRALSIRIQWQQGKTPTPRLRRPPAKEVPIGIHLAKEPNDCHMPIANIIDNHGAELFRPALRTFIAAYLKKHIAPGQTATQLQVPDDVHVWHRVKFGLANLFVVEDKVTRYTAHCAPARKAPRTQKALPGRFDTILVQVDEKSARSAGLDGKRVGQLRVAFKIPDEYNRSIFGSVTPPAHLAYVEWFSKPKSHHRDKVHGMFPVSRTYRSNGDRMAAIVELSSVVRPCQLSPKFDTSVNRAWTSENVLERAKNFFINHYSDQHMYQTVF
ncbi:hypothetical protein EIP91_000598 [Steccherinum ochraceum]|uniref:Uncharacterized protein n=1 Tax=Steccherinum ochraceum TaxID=92696 RepID=A0A4R0RHY0_9APHY|nr:hypothetical protein EIP91_000598 [Steccherinum ochraceum]